MSLQVSKTRLQKAAQELALRWDQAKAKWDDPMSRKFEKRFLRNLEPRVRNSMAAMEKMQEILIRIQRECG